MERKMSEIFNGRLGHIGDCCFLNYDMLERQEETLAKDPVMIALAKDVEELYKEKRESDKRFNEKASILREAARIRIKATTDEKYV